MKPIKTMTIRLSADQSEELGTIAAVDGRPVSHVIRSAITRHIEVRKRDAAFQEMLRQRIERASADAAKRQEIRKKVGLDHEGRYSQYRKALETAPPKLAFPEHKDRLSLAKRIVEL